MQQQHKNQPQQTQNTAAQNQKLEMNKYKYQNQSVPIVTYYYIRGLCQPIRHLLYYLGIQFEDRRLDRNSLQSLQLDKLESTFNSGLPSFKDNQVAISDSIAICLYICNKYGAFNLKGANIQSKSRVNQVLFKYWMEKKKIMPQIVEIIRKTTGYHENEKGVMIRQLIHKLTNETRFINYCLRSYQINGDWVLGELTLVDFFFYETCFYINGFFNSYIEADKRLSNFVSFAHKFQKLQFHQKHSATSTKLFFPFKNQNLKQIVISAWQGSEIQDIL